MVMPDDIFRAPEPARMKRHVTHAGLGIAGLGLVAFFIAPIYFEGVVAFFPEWLMVLLSQIGSGALIVFGLLYEIYEIVAAIRS